MVNIKQLLASNSEYDSEQMEKLRLLYEGGYEILKHADLFMKKSQVESQESFRERQSIISFIPYVSKFVNTFAASLFMAELYAGEAADADDEITLGKALGTQDNFYRLFAADCNLHNQSLHNFMKQKFTEALYLPYVLVGADFANPANLPSNILEEEEWGLSRAYLYCIDPTSMVDWSRDADSNKFDWVKLMRECVIQQHPLDEPMKYLEFKLWTMRDGFAHWELYQTKLIKMNQNHNLSNKDVPLLDSGLTSWHEIPVWEMQIPGGFHVGEKVGPINEEHWNRRSFFVSNLNKTCIAIPVVKLGPEIGAPGDPMMSEEVPPNRGQNMQQRLSSEGYTVIGADDDIVIREATGTSHLTMRDDIKDLESRMPEIINQMAASAAYMLKFSQHSAASKKEDRHQTEILLMAYSQIVRDFVKEIYNAISAARGEEVVWSIGGLSTFIEDNRQELMQELFIVAGKDTPLLSLFPSITLQKKYLLKMGLSLVGTASPEEERTIQEELEAGIQAGLHTELQNKIALAAVEPPDPKEPD